MAEFDPTKASPKKPLELGEINLEEGLRSGAERNNEISQLEAGLAGIASGIIKIPEGFVSLGAEIMDATGMTTNAAAKVEQAFDKINPFEEIAEQKAAGILLQTLLQIGVPSALGAKLASKLATKALQARKTGNYINLKNKNISKGVETANKLNKRTSELSGKEKVVRFGVAVAGGAAGETLVGDVEDIGTFGDSFKIGPTQLDVEELSDSKEDAFRKLINRAKFGADSLLYFPFIYGTILGVGEIAKFGKKLAFSSSIIDRRLNQAASAVRPTSNTPTEIFLAKNREEGAKAADANFAME